MAKVFISYVSEDLEAVKRIVGVLREFDMEVWFDRDTIKPGMRWPDEIRRGIESGDFFVALFSTAYEARTKSYVNEELTLAIEELRLRPSNRAWFIPVRLDDCQIPDRSIGAGETLRSIQWVDLHSEWPTGMEKLLSVLAPGSERIPRLIEQMYDMSERRRVAAYDALGELGTLAQAIVPQLIEQIAIEWMHFGRRTTALEALYEALVKIDPSTSTALKHLEANVAMWGLYDALTNSFDMTFDMTYVIDGIERKHTHRPSYSSFWKSPLWSSAKKQTDSPL